MSRYFSILILAATAFIVRAADLTEATFTQVVNNVTVASPASKELRPAKVQTKFITPQILRTGANSRAELTAPDKTVTRVGANTIFSFKPNSRTINLQKGSVLFNSPPGQGGGTIQTAAATASVLGTTIMVSFDPKVGCKLLVLEGTAKIMLPNGQSTTVRAGQMIIIPNGATSLPPVVGFLIDKTKKNANLLSGFDDKLPSEDKILAAIREQDRQLANGDLKIMQSGNDTFLIDPNTQQAYFIEQQQRQEANKPKPPPSPPPYIPPPINGI